jgi:MFS family permease
MVFAEELASAYTLSGLQLDVSGIIGPLLGGLLISLVGVSVIFGVNGVGVLLMLLAILQWKRVRPQSNLSLETFFESLTTAIRYVRYTVGIKILLDLSANRRVPVSFVRGSSSAERISDGSGGVLLEAIPVAKRATDHKGEGRGR